MLMYHIPQEHIVAELFFSDTLTYAAYKETMKERRMNVCPGKMRQKPQTKLDKIAKVHACVVCNIFHLIPHHICIITCTGRYPRAQVWNVI